MRTLFIAAVRSCALILGAVAVCFSGPAPGANAIGSTYKVGVASRRFVPPTPYDWRNAKTHAILATIWYPAAAAAREEAQWVGDSRNPFARAGEAAPDTTMAPTPRRFPLIVISHGTGGSALAMAWLGTRLAAHGFIAVAVNHPGNNALEPYTPQGFTLLKSDAGYRAAVQGAARSYRDPRVRAVFAIAPALGGTFVPASLERISIPVEIVAGSADPIEPVNANAKYFAAHITGSRLVLFPGAGHYTFFATCTAMGKKSQPGLCDDPAGIDRHRVHQRAAEMAVLFFSAHLSSAASTSNPASFHAKMPPVSGRTRMQPMRISCCATRAAEASLGHAQ